MGAKKFFAVYLFGAFFGAFAWLATSVGDTAGLVGASASVMAVFAAFCFFYPPVPITFLIFFVLPVSMRPMTMLKIAAVFEALGLAYSLSGGDAAIAYAAHLGGMAAGALFAVSFQRGLLGFLDKIAAPNFSLKGKRGNRANVETYSYRVNITDPVELKRK
ncbi:MAG: rhomboid family intramembrane serine protease [Bacilli bacterium]